MPVRPSVTAEMVALVRAREHALHESTPTVGSAAGTLFVLGAVWTIARSRMSR